MKRTSAGLIAIGRHLTSPMAGVARTVDESSIRFPTRAFERLASCHTDLDALESVLDRLSGSEEQSAIKDGTGAQRRRRRTMLEAKPAPTMSAPHARQEVARDLRAAGDDRALPSRGPATQVDGPSRGDASRNGLSWREPASGTDVSPSEPFEVASAADDSAVTGSARGNDEGRERARGPRPGRNETRSDTSGPATHEQPTREEMLRRSRPRVGDASTPQSLDDEPVRPRSARQPSDHQLAPRGALGDLVRRAGSQRYRNLVARSSADAVPRMDSAPYLPVDSTRGEPQHNTSDATPNTHLIEAFEFAMDELVRREAERHGLEGEL